MVKPITVSIIQAPPTPHRKSQASLDALLKFVLECPNDRIAQVKNALHRVARLKTISHLEEFPSSWESLTQEGWNSWENSFTGKIHCESILACLENAGFQNQELIDKISKPSLRQLQEISTKLTVRNP